MTWEDSEGQFLLGVITDAGHYGRARLVAKNPGVWHYQVAVPRGVSLRIMMDSPHPLRDAARAVENRKPSLPVVVPAAGDVHVQLTVN